VLTTLMLGFGLANAAPEMIPEEKVDLVGTTAQSFEAQMWDGSTFKLEDQRGKTVVLSFWASWCGPCRKELPALSEMQSQRDDVVVYAVNVDRTKQEAQRFLAQVSFDLPIVWDNNSEAMGSYDVLSMPTMFLIDANGTIKWRKTGFSTENGLTALEEQLDALR